MQDTEEVFQKYATTKDKKTNSRLALYMTREILQKKLDEDIEDALQ